MGSVLALDLGTKMGFAIVKGGVITSGTRKLHHNRSASGARFLDFRNWLIVTIDTCGIDRVYFERVYAHKGTDAAHVYGGFMYTLAAVCVEKKILCVGIPVGTIKKFATGSGNATKEEMIAAARSRGFNPIDDNEADALAILLAGLNALSSQQSYGSCFAMGASGSQSPIAFLASEI
jgi:Holliday junction resolvasome RuvABC endonuclease subunit